MRIRSARDLGALVRDQRRRRDLTQADLAERIGASRKWLVDFEHGKSRAEVGLALKALAALGVTLDASTDPRVRRPTPGGGADATWSLDAHLDRLRENP